METRYFNSTFVKKSSINHLTPTSPAMTTFQIRLEALAAPNALTGAPLPALTDTFSVQAADRRMAYRMAPAFMSIRPSGPDAEHLYRRDAGRGQPLMQPAALFLCEKSLRTAQDWADAGYLCYCVDLAHPAGETRVGNMVLVGADIHQWTPPAGVAFSFACAMPTCTDLTKSGARWWKGKGLRKLAEAILLVARCTEILEALGCPYYLENPNGALSTHWRKPDFDFDPCEYAGYLPPAERIDEAYTKRTNLWTGGGGFCMPLKQEVVPVLGSKMHLVGPGPDRAAIRSESPRGFALAVFLSNSHIPTSA